MKLSFRSIIIGLIFAILICFIVSYAELVITYIQIGFLQLPPAVIGVFFFIVLINRFTRKIRKRFGLSSQELMVIYCMMLIASMISSRGMMEKLIPALVGVNYFANEANNWAELFFPNIRDWLVPFSTSGQAQQPIVTQFYEQLDSNSPIPWEVWIKPLLIWGILIILIFFGFLCLASILRRQWVNNEKLTFPLVQLPLEFVEAGKGKGGFLNNYVMWVGFGIVALIFALNGLHRIYPVVPNFKLHQNLNQYFTERPFNAMAYTPLYLSFAAIGFFYMLPVQLLFSLWFFFIFTRIQDIMAATMGFRVSTMPLYPTRMYIGYQVAGAYFALIVYFVYVSIPYLKKVFGRAFAGKSVDDSNELMPHRVAVWGLLASLTGSVIWCYYAGITLWFAVIEIVVYVCVVAVIMARSTAEGGLLMTETSFRPIDLYQMFGNKSHLGSQTLTTLSFMDAIFTRDQRGLILTGFLDSLKISDEVGNDSMSRPYRKRKLLIVFSVAIIVALVCSAGIQLWLPYQHGANYMYGYAYKSNCIWAFQDNAAAVEGLSAKVGWTAPLFFSIGVVVTIVLSVMRTLYWWWPFHPLAYALSASWTMIVFWFPVLIAWLIKYPIMRYGGVRLYRKIRPFFLGMIFGEFSMAVIWTLISWIANVPAPFFPWP